MFEDVEPGPSAIRRITLPDPLVRMVRAMRASSAFDHHVVHLGDEGLIMDFAGWVIEQAAAWACGNEQAEGKLWKAYRYWKDEVDRRYGKANTG